MRVLHVTGAYPVPENPSSGVTIEAQVESLRRKGIEVDVCVLEGVGIGKYIRGISKIRLALKRKSYDLLNAHYMYAGWSARLASTLPLVVTFLGNDVFGDPDSGGRYSLTTRLFHIGMSNMLALVSAHSLSKSIALRRPLLARNVTVLPDGVDMGVFKPVNVERRSLGLLPGKKYVLFAGKEEDPVKRFDLANAAFELVRQEFPESELIVIRKKLHGVVRDYLNAVDCLLLTSTHEGSPNIVKESLACNLPVVSVNVGDAHERLDGVDNCFVVSHDPAEIAVAVREVLRSNRRSLNARESLHELDINRIAERIIDVYRMVLAS